MPRRNKIIPDATSGLAGLKEKGKKGKSEGLLDPARQIGSVKAKMPTALKQPGGKK